MGTKSVAAGQKRSVSDFGSPQSNAREFKLHSCLYPEFIQSGNVYDHLYTMYLFYNIAINGLLRLLNDYLIIIERTNKKMLILII